MSTPIEHAVIELQELSEAMETGRIQIHDLKDWDIEFLKSMSLMYEAEGDDIYLSEKQIEQIDRIYEEHFGMDD